MLDVGCWLKPDRRAKRLPNQHPTSNIQHPVLDVPLQPDLRPIRYAVRLSLGPGSRAVSARPLAPQTDCRHAALLGRRRAAYRGGAAEEDPATTLAAAAAHQHLPAAAGHSPVARRISRRNAVRSCADPRDLGLDGRPLGEDTARPAADVNG